MRTLIASLMAVISAAAVHAAYPELNAAAGTIDSADGLFSGRDFVMAKDFKLELIYNVPTNQGKWVAMAWDSKGRLLVPSYNSDVLTRLTIPSVGSSDPIKSEIMSGTQVGAAEGILDAFGGVYFNVNRSTTMRHGLYKLTDTNGDDVYDKIDVIRNVVSGGDHGTHNLRLSPDGNSIFIVSGNQTNPTVYGSSRVPMIYGEDTLTMRIQTGFMNSTFGDHTNEGFVMKTDKDGKSYELFSMGNRNPVDIAFNKDGELFLYDSDMEWDMGDPWYRPTHVDHVTSGADFGFRNGSRKHPRYYFDYAGPSVADVGSGSPVGNTFGTGAKFPARYQDAMFIADWSYGNLYSVFMTPTGSTYKGQVQPFLSGRPFAVSGVIVNPKDGSLLVTTTGSELYRVTYTGPESTVPTRPDTTFATQRQTRKDLEAFHGHADPAAVDKAWQYLGDADSRIRFAARIALEWQPQAAWRDKALNERDPRKSMSAIIALARLNGKDIYSTRPDTPAADKNLQAQMLASLNRINVANLATQDKLDLLRSYALTFIRLGAPDDATKRALIAKFDPLLPAREREMNWELADMLTYLGAPSVPQKLMALIHSAPGTTRLYPIEEWINPELRSRNNPANLGPPGQSNAVLAKQEDQVYYAQLLRTAKDGWTMPLREDYMKWFVTDLGNYRGGNEFGSSNTIIRADAVAMLPADAAAALKDIIDAPIPTVARGGGGGAAAPAAGAAAPAGGAPAPAGAAPAAGGGRGGRGRAGAAGGAAAPATPPAAGGN